MHFLNLNLCCIVWSGQRKASVSMQPKIKQTSYIINQDGAISSLSGGSIKLVDQFIYLGSNISSTESDVNIRLGKAWSAIDWLTTI